MEMSLACNEKMWSEEDEGTGTFINHPFRIPDNKAITLNIKVRRGLSKIS